MPKVRVPLEWEVVIWYASDNPNGYVTGKRFSIDEPSLTVMAKGMGGGLTWSLAYISRRRRLDEISA